MGSSRHIMYFGLVHSINSSEGLDLSKNL